jgi:zinc-ribbon domain
MEHPCHQCGAPVEDGTAFCKQCGAPQIRVPVEEPATQPLPPGTPGEVQPPAEPVTLAGAPGALPAGIDWSQAVPAAALAGVLLALAWVVPFLGFLLWLLAGGTLGVVIYRRRVPGAALTPRLGARIGAVTGLFGFGVFAVVLALELLATRGGGRLRQMLQQVIQETAARNPDPRAQAALQQMMTPGGLALIITVVLVFFLVVFLALSSGGGALGAWLLGKRSKGGQS